MARLLHNACGLVLLALVASAAGADPIIKPHPFTTPPPQVVISDLHSDPPGALIYADNGAYLGEADSPAGIPMSTGYTSQLVTFTMDGHETVKVQLRSEVPHLKQNPVIMPPNDNLVAFQDMWRYRRGTLLGTVAGVAAVLALGCFGVVRHIRKTMPVASSATTFTMVGVIFDGYKIVDELGQGTFSHVFQAIKVDSQEVVAMKVLKSEFLDTQTSDALVRFHREAMVHLQHKNVVQVYGCGDYQGRPYIVLEMIEGTTLRRRLRPRLEVPEALSVFLQMCHGLSFAHKRGYVHRDLKPENVMMDNNEVVKIMDFGIAKHVNRPAATRTATTMGTPAYMSPEHIDSSKTDGRSDIYSMGIILFELLTGRTPFEGDMMELIAAHMYAPAPLLTHIDDSLPLELNPIVEKMLQKQQDDRYQSIDAVIVAVTQCCERLNVPLPT